MNIQITGVEELRKKLSDINLTRLDNMWIVNSTLILQGEAQLNVPPNIDTGNMRRQITFHNLNEIGYVKAEAPYSIFIHEGTRFIKNNNPFMTKALDDNKDRIINNYKTLLSNHIKELGLSN